MKAIFLLLALIITTIAVPTAHAGDTGDCPTNFVVNAVSPYEIQLSWTNGGNMTNAVLRGTYGRWPTNALDGFEVYTGTGSSVTHWVNTEFIGVDVYYRVWGEIGGNYSLCYASGTVQGGESVSLIGSFIGMGVFSVMVLGLTLGGYLGRKAVLAIAAGAFWLLLSVYSYTQSGAMWDTYYGVFFVSALMTIVCIFEAVMINRTVSKDEKGETKIIMAELSDEDKVRGEEDTLQKQGDKLYKSWRRNRRLR